MKIAVSGKGGVGKTTMSANLVKLYVKNGYKVIAVDADPDSSLGYALGIPQEQLDKIIPLCDLEDKIKEKQGDGAFYRLNPLVDDIINDYAIDIQGARFLRMGAVKKGDSECYCRENIFLKSIVDSLILDVNDIVILDMGAGIEHLTRGTSTGVDIMLIVTEPGRSSVNTARIVEKLAKEVGVEHIKFIANKVRSEKEELFIQEHFKPSELLGIVRYDEAISEKGMGIGQIAGEVDNQELQQVLMNIVADKSKVNA